MKVLKQVRKLGKFGKVGEVGEVENGIIIKIGIASDFQSRTGFAGRAARCRIVVIEST